MEEIDFSAIKLKSADNFDPIYKLHIVMNETITFLQEYEHLIYEEDFPRLFAHHVEKTHKEILNRISVYYSDAAQKSKSLGIEHLLQQILIENVSESARKSWLKHQCFSLLRAFNILVSKINDAIRDIPVAELFRNDFISTNAMHLRKLIIDSEEFLMGLESYKGATPKRQIGFNRGVKGFDSNWFAELLFNGIVDSSNFAFFVNLAFLLRDSIELRVRNGLGIREISMPDGKPAKIANDDFVDFLFNNENIIIPKLNKALIKKAFDWCNFHIHRGVVLYEWQLVLCYEYVRPLFAPGETDSQLSLYGAVQMNELYYRTKLANDLEQFLIEKSPKNTGVQVTLLDSPEAMLIK